MDFNLSMAKRKGRVGRPSKKSITIKSDETRLVFALLTGLFSIFCILSIFSEGEAFLTLKSFFGGSLICLGILSAAISLKLFGLNWKILNFFNLLGLGFFVVFLSGLLHLGIDSSIAFSEAEIGNGGGIIGYFVSSQLVSLFSNNGALMVVLVGLFLCILIFTGTTLSQLRDLVLKSSDRVKLVSENMISQNQVVEDPDSKKSFGDFVGAITGKNRIQTQNESAEQGINNGLENSLQAAGNKTNGNTNYIGTANAGFKTKLGAETLEEKTDDNELFGKLQYESWKLPSIDLLALEEKYDVDPSIQKRNSEIIEETLKSFGIRAKVVDVLQGPTVSQYALSISVGTKVSRIVVLANDIALALAAPSGKVRIDAPIPGTSLVGIEVPNETKAMVRLRTLMQAQEMNNNKYRLPVPIGLDVACRPIIKDISKMPHLLVAGQTGSGKSVAINAILMGLLLKNSPDTLRLILVDPKRVELSEYNGIPHLLHPVIERPEEVANALDWALTEMSRRYDMFKAARARNIETYNQFMGFSALPYIVIVVDEMADLMMMKKVDIESKIVRIAQMARATGIHLVLATQRPSVDVVTGLIKANIPARVALTVATSVDSRVILDAQGAENLLGHGDMLLSTAEMPKPIRVQGVFCADDEIVNVLNEIKQQVEGEEIRYIDDVVRAKPPEGAILAGDGKTISDDPMFIEAVNVIILSQKASASLLQRRLKLGYNRAARIIDEMEMSGIIGPQEGIRPRKVLITDPSQIGRV